VIALYKADLCENGNLEGFKQEISFKKTNGVKLKKEENITQG